MIVKIVFVTPALDMGGGQRYVTELANYWANKGHIVSIISLRNLDNFYDISNKVEIVKFNYQYSGRISKLFAGIKLMFQLRKIIKLRQPDFVLSILSTTNILTIISTTFLKTRIIIRDAFSNDRKRKKLDIFLRKILYRRANGIIAQSKEIKIDIENNTDSKNVRVIPNPIRQFDIERMTIREKILLNVGRLHTQKGQKYFIEACAKINRPDWKYIVIGEGNSRESLEKQIKKLNGQCNIQLKGAIKNIDEWLLKSSIFVFPSLYEGLPNALIEAMSAGLACVSFDCETGPRDLIKDGKNGFLVPVGEVEQMVSKIQELIDDEELRIRFSKEAIKTTKPLNTQSIADQVMNFCISS